MSALMNPGVNALMGFAQGAAQAAMPSRMPIGFGAQLGMAGAGAVQGVQNSQAMQLGQQQLQAAQIQNQQARMLLNFYKGTQGGDADQSSSQIGAPAAPFGAPAAKSARGSAGSGASGSSTANGSPAPDGSGSPNYLTPPQRLLALANISMAAGNPRAAAQFYQQAQDLAGGAGYAMGPNGQAFAVPGGAKDPSVMAGNSYATASGAGAGGLPSTIAAQNNQAALTRGNAANAALFGPPVSFNGPGPDGKLHSYTIPASAYYAPGGMGAPGGSAAANAPPSGSSPPNGVMSATDFANRVRGAENSGGNPAALNGSGANGTPSSSAVGNGQFIQSTWLQNFKQAFPQEAGQYSDQQILGLRADPQWSGAVTIALAQRNSTALQNMGLPVNAQTLGMAHQLGAGGAIAVLNANGSAPLSSVLPAAVVAANPSFEKQTVGSFQANAAMRFGTLPVDLSGGAGGSGNPNSYPGAIMGAQVLTPEQSAVSTAYGDEGKDILDANTKAPDEMTKLDVLDSAATGFRPGATGNMRLDAMKSMTDALQAIGVTPPAWMTNGTASGETIGKEGMQLAVDLTRTLGSREAMGVLTMIKGVMPNVELSQGGYQVILSGLRQGVMRDQDLNSFYENWMKDPAHGGSWQGGESAFDRIYSPTAYASRVVAMPAPKSAASAQPNVIYQTPRGPMLWTGSSFKSPYSDGGQDLGVYQGAGSQ